MSISVLSIPTVAAKLGRTAAAGSFLSLVSIFRGDITRLSVDAIVNAADNALLGGGGVDGAIHRAAGPRLLAECRTLNGCATGAAKITKGYDLPATYVIHTVGPVGEHPELLRSAYRSSLDVAKKNGVRTIAFPCISTGVFGYPAEAACRVVLGAVEEWLRENGGAIERVVFCMFNDQSERIYSEQLANF
ncbi:Appr-1-p processing domain-containing protein [Linderina pennispora]|uniref:Appr-1-p processing domain-containing protein n=1 Tax=Linderina pennispora TaxID=61395 RepID=A0A1Y1W3A9_9FUNG|nr:Appr-1-p processing domain-containing protein [Linderina pennispora]ORX67644.1 Appr-1-p processing domain-containing protein [Linderina pennispora]